MIDTKTITENLKNDFKEIFHYKVQTAFDFEEEREPLMVIIGISEIENVNYGLEDFRITTQILVDSFIDEDPLCENCNEVSIKILERLFELETDSQERKKVFGEDIVGLIFKQKTFRIENGQNRIFLNFDLIYSNNK